MSTTRHIGVPDAGSLCSPFGLLLHAFGSLTVNHCCLESKITGVGVRPDSVINAPIGVGGSAPRTHLACRLNRTRRSSLLPTGSGSHKSSLPVSAITWTQATWNTLTLLATAPYVFVRVRSLASAGLAIFRHWLWCSLNVRFASIQTPSQRTAWLLNHI